MKDILEKIEFNGSWLGFVIVALGLFLFYAGDLSSIFTVIQYAFLIALFGVAISIMGRKPFMIILVPMVMLFFMIPLPVFLFKTLSSDLQLFSSKIGVGVIRLFDISVYLKGNVIDLGVYKLQVVEACSGLNYLFPLMTLGFISANFFTGAFLTAILITFLAQQLQPFTIGYLSIKFL
ncbi:MAG: exosortase/archaeosortase family protein [Methylococcales bacterium]